MARSYTVSTLYSNTDYTLLLAMDWSYGDPAESVSRSGKHTLSVEAQTTPVGLTHEKLVSILTADLPNTTKQFDEDIKAEIARKEEESTVNIDGAPKEGTSDVFTIPDEPLPEPPTALPADEEN